MNDVDDLTGNYLRAQEGILRSGLTPPAARVLDVLLKIAFLEGRTEAPISVFQDLAIAANVHKGNLSRHLHELITSEIITGPREDNGCYYYEIKPDWQMWRCRRRYTHAQEALMEQALRRLRAVGKSDPAQVEFSARGFERTEDFDAEVSRSFASAAVVPGTTPRPEGGEKVVPGTTIDPECVPGTTDELVVPGTLPSCWEEVVPGTLDPFIALGAVQLKGSIAPNALGAEGAALPEPDGEQKGCGDDPDLAVLIERMWLVIPDQRVPNARGDCFAGVWMNRAARLPRAMRMAVDKWLESPPQKLKTTSWQWLRAEYIANAYRLGLQDKLAPYDQERRGFWSRLTEGARHSLFT